MASKIFQRGKKGTWWYEAYFNGQRFKESLRTTDKKKAVIDQRNLDSKYGGSTDPYIKPDIPKLGELIDAHMEWARDWYKPGKHGRCSSVDVLTHSLETVCELEGLLAYLQALAGTQLATPRAGRDPLGTVQQARWEALAPFAERLWGHLDRRLGEGRSRLITLKLAALLHDTGKPAMQSMDDDGRIRFIGHPQEGVRITGQALRRLRFNRAEVRLGQTIVRHHMRPLLLASQESVSSRAVYRFFRDTGAAGVEVLLHALADHQATSPPDAEDDRWSRLVSLTARMLADYWERGAERVDPPLLVDGNDLQREFGLQPGPHIGELLEAVREAQVNGEVSTREGALELVRSRVRLGRNEEANQV